MATQTEVAQKINAAVLEAERRIFPARLANVQSNIFSVMAYIAAQGLDTTQPESYIAAFKAIYKSLEWAVKPAKLLADEKNDENKPVTVQSAMKFENEFEAKVRVGEKKDADALEHGKLVSQCKALIDGYNPTTRNGYDAREREEMQALWIKELHKAKEKSVEYMRSFTKSLVAKREKRYADREKARERL